MNFKELTYSILETISAYNITDDNEFSKVQIEEVMLSMNSSLVREAYNNKKISQSLYLTDKNLEIKELTNDVLVKGVKIKANANLCYVELEALVQGIGYKDVIYVGPADFATNYKRKSFRQLINGSDGTQWELEIPAYAIVSNILYIERKNLANAKFVNVVGIWRDPREVSGYSESMQFPTPSEKKLQLLTIQHMFVGKNIPPDLMNDAQRYVGMPTGNKVPERQIRNAESK